MTQRRKAPSPERVAILRWAARMGAITAEALAFRLGTTVASARAQLSVSARERLLSSRRPLVGQPTLYTVTSAGLRLTDSHGLDSCRVSPANALHLIACARAAAALERCYPDRIVMGERELRRDERQQGAPLASACLGLRPDGGRLLHRPDLVLWPRGAGSELPVAVEVELTIKAPRRLADICRAWARCRCVAGVLYLAPPAVEHALERAIEQAHAGERVVVVPLDSLPFPEGVARPSIANRPKRCVVSSRGSTI